MKTLKLITLTAALFAVTGCGNNKNTIVVGATPCPHSEILNSKAVQDYVKSQGYTLKVKIYQDYITPNKALDDYGLDANYFQHITYLNKEINEKGYDISPACKVHFEPLSLYSKEAVSSFQNAHISIINDESNALRALELLKANNIITSYDGSNFDAGHLVYTSDLNVTITAIAEALLTNIVDDDGLAVIPGNFALTKWGVDKATSYKRFTEANETAGNNANIIAVRTSDLNSEKTNILVDALNQPSVQSFIETKYGPTVSYLFEDLRK